MTTEIWQSQKKKKKKKKSVNDVQQEPGILFNFPVIPRFSGSLKFPGGIEM